MKPSLTDDARKVAKRAAQLGAVLAIVCHVVPPDYRAICHAVADICSGKW